MQFRHPEILYGLLLLIIPIIIHLFHFQKFTKVSFTNVKFLKRIEQHSRKSSKLKKWLILATRLLAFASVILAFAQPFFAENTLSQEQRTIIYIDNSLSMSAKIGSYELLDKTTQNILEHLNEVSNLSILTNDNFLTNLDTKTAKRELLNIDYTSKKLDFETISLRLKQELSKEKNTIAKIILISDFQKNKGIEKVNFSDISSNISLVKINPTTSSNTSIDSLYVSDKNDSEVSIKVLLRNDNKKAANVSVSLYNTTELLGKATTSFSESNMSEVEFKTPYQQNFSGKVIIEDEHLAFDNSMFFNIHKPQKIKVLYLGKQNTSFQKIYTSDKFDLQHKYLNQIDFNQISSQHLVILNEIDEISNNLSNALKTFENNGGTIVIIPSIDSEISTYKSFFNTLNCGTFSELIKTELKITKIHFDHPIFKDVFENEIKNFDYPSIQQYFKIRLRNGSTILSLENEIPFLSEVGSLNGNIFVFNSPLESKYSNFYNAPIVVPVLYNMGMNSYKFPKLYYTVGNNNTIEVNVPLQKDRILKLKNDKSEIIPLQQVFTHKTELSTNDIPSESGFFNITNNNKLLQTIAYNYNRSESQLEYSNLKDLFQYSKNVTISNSVEDTFSDLINQQKMNSLFRWFLTIAILFLLLEICILKFFKT